MINNGIHPGEPDGIEASQMLVRNFAQKKKQKLIKDLVVAVIPIYNIGGALNRNSYSRVNQKSLGLTSENHHTDYGGLGLKPIVGLLAFPHRAEARGNS